MNTSKKPKHHYGAEQNGYIRHFTGSGLSREEKRACTVGEDSASNVLGRLFLSRNLFNFS